MRKLAVNAAVILLLVGCAAQIPAFNAGTPCEASSFTVVNDFAEELMTLMLETLASGS